MKTAGCSLLAMLPFNGCASGWEVKSIQEEEKK
jgi:hypothetical protein